MSENKEVEKLAKTLYGYSNKTKSIIWPEKPKISQNDDDFNNGLVSGKRAMHDKFMKIILEAGL